MTDEPRTKKHAHCWHASGGGMTLGSGTAGWENVVCCRCGATSQRDWHIEYRAIRGHGPFAKRSVTVYDLVARKI